VSLAFGLSSAREKTSPPHFAQWVTSMPVSLRKRSTQVSCPSAMSPTGVVGMTGAGEDSSTLRAATSFECREGQVGVGREASEAHAGDQRRPAARPVAGRSHESLALDRACQG
jgi:hypothetical protein